MVTFRRRHDDAHALLAARHHAHPGRLPKETPRPRPGTSSVLGIGALYVYGRRARPARVVGGEWFGRVTNRVRGRQFGRRRGVDLLDRNPVAARRRGLRSPLPSLAAPRTRPSGTIAEDDLPGEPEVAKVRQQGDDQAGQVVCPDVNDAEDNHVMTPSENYDKDRRAAVVRSPPAPTTRR